MVAQEFVFWGKIFPKLDFTLAYLLTVLVSIQSSKYFLPMTFIADLKSCA